VAECGGVSSFIAHWVLGIGAVHGHDVSGWCVLQMRGGVMLKFAKHV
jgi:hypothetical protein